MCIYTVESLWGAWTSVLIIEVFTLGEHFLLETLGILIYVVILCPRDSYFVDVTWIDNSTVHVTWLNRGQNTSVYALYDVHGSGEIENYYEYYIYNGWVELVSVSSNGTSLTCKFL